MSSDYPTLDEQYGPGAEQADAEAQDDVVTELQEAIDSPSEYNHRYWAEIAGRAVKRLGRRCVWTQEQDYPVYYAGCKDSEAFHLAPGLDLYPYCHWCGGLIEIGSAHSGDCDAR